jgi:hypothetical protein
MNERIQELYKSCRSKEALASQEQFQSANVLLGTEVEKFAELIIRECCFTGEQYAEGLIDPSHYAFINKKIKEHFGVEE